MCIQWTFKTIHVPTVCTFSNNASEGSAVYSEIAQLLYPEGNRLCTISTGMFGMPTCIYVTFIQYMCEKQMNHNNFPAFTKWQPMPH